MKKILLTTLLFGFIKTVYAVPLTYDLNMSATTGTASSGTLTIESTSLDLLPATGFAFSTSDAILGINVTVNGVVFDTPNVVDIYVAADGQASGMTAITYSWFFSSVNPDVKILFNSAAGYPYDWNMYDLSGRNLLASGDYSIGALHINDQGSSKVPEPEALLLMSLGLLGLGLSRKKRIV